MLTILKFNLSLLLLIFACCLFAEKAEQDSLLLKDIYGELTEKYDAFTSYQAAFTQINQWGEKNIEMQSEGNIYLTENELALHYKKPEGQKLVVIDSAIFLFNDAEKSLLITNIGAGDNFSPIDIIKQYWNSSKLFYNQIENNHLITLLPVTDEEIKEISVKINKLSGFIKNITYYDDSGNSVSFNFSDEVIDHRIADDIFDISYDSSYTVFDQRF